MLDNLTTTEKVLTGAVAIGITALIFHKPTRNSIGLSEPPPDPDFSYYGQEQDRLKKKKRDEMLERSKINKATHYDEETGETYLLFQEGSKQELEELVKKILLPKWAKLQKIKIDSQYGLYVTKK